MSKQAVSVIYLVVAITAYCLLLYALFLAMPGIN